MSAPGNRPTLGGCRALVGMFLLAGGCAPEVDDVAFGPLRPDGGPSPSPAPRGGPEERPFWRNKDAGAVDAPVLVDPPGSPAPPQRDGGAAPA
ncbi:MAG: hypothetical protein HY909_24350, partial [Deltaproteobacteria bacterium]|nr:hypothetical protein [Deltaproteobacteria bacterium]